MRKIMDHLLALQKLQFDLLGQTVTSKAEAEQLRGEVPSPILAHYERLVARGKKGLALVRTGVCSECHLRLTAGKLVNLSATPNEIHLCDNCGRYLYLPEEVAPGMIEVSVLPPPRIKRTRKQVAQHVG